MSNIVKGYHAAIDEDDKKVIDSNSMVADRIKLLKTILDKEQSPMEDFSADGFTEGLDVEMVDSILMDPDAEPGEEGAGNVIKAEAPPAQPAVDLDAINAEAEQIIEDAQAQADQLIQDAMEQAEASKAQIFEEARQAGHDEGYSQGLAEADAMKAELAEKEQALISEYEQMAAELEPTLVDMLSDIYSHVIGIEMEGKKEIIFYLLQNALQNTDTTANLMVHVSKDDYEYIVSHKSELFDGIPGEDNTDIVPDVTLGTGEAMIDTGSGIFDCSVGTELDGLRKQLKLLSYQRSEAG
ncbi:MAG: hypothetical protein IJ075_05300 [Lachnospiraceae bacterium]|nr:hypothetical protein [Lachnospiraceae bacterium]MBQ9607246.1 hypothetical protein [Lachnospiraceae bacterium]MBR1523388.1 hypothetical protein [Lachnospiraceae bacterium]